MISEVAHKTIIRKDKQSVINEVSRVMCLANWNRHIKGPKIFIKVNLLSNQLVPGQCTSPWVLEGVLKELKQLNAEICVGDADVATSRQAQDAAQKWGIIEVCDKNNAKFVNLSNRPTKQIHVGGHIFTKVELPDVIADADSIITIPVIKTHNVTIMTCALKNQWGCMPRFRHQFHPVAHKAIPEINVAVKVNFVVADGTVCMEGTGPRVGVPKVMNSVFATHDLVAMDTVAAVFMGINPKKVGYIQNAKKIGLGSTDYRIIGDELIPEKFKSAKLENQPIVLVEMFLRRIPLLKYFIFKTPFFKIPAWFAAKYNSFFWYNLKGKRHARKIVDKYPLYRKEFLELLKRIRKY